MAGQGRAGQGRAGQGRAGHKLGASQRWSHLLVAPLHRAVPLVKVHNVAVVVSQDLHFNVAGRVHILLNEHAPVPKG